MIRDIENARRQFQPSISGMRSSLPDVGESINTACIDLERDLTLERLDDLMARLNAAQQNLGHLRRAMVAELGGHA